MNTHRVSALAISLLLASGALVSAPAHASETESATDLPASSELEQAMAHNPQLARSVDQVRAKAKGRKLTAGQLATLVEDLPQQDQAVLGVQQTVDRAAGRERSEAALGAGSDATAEATMLGLCIRKAWGPGRVEWKFNPSNFRYSVKPESTWSLIWAAQPGQDVDGVYRYAWGQKALKIPDSATVTFTGVDQWSKCENAAMAALGHRVVWVVPGDIGWPANPK